MKTEKKGASEEINILADKERRKRQKSSLDTKPGRLSSVRS